MTLAFDPSQPLRIMVRLDSPHYVTFGMWYKRPDDCQWTAFAGGQDDSSANSSGHDYQIGALPLGSALYYFFHFAGQPQTAYRAEITLIQVQKEIAEPIAVDGITDNRGLAKEEKEIELS